MSALHTWNDTFLICKRAAADLMPCLLDDEGHRRHTKHLLDQLKPHSDIQSLPALLCMCLALPLDRVSHAS